MKRARHVGVILFIIAATVGLMFRSSKQGVPEHPNMSSAALAPSGSSTPLTPSATPHAPHTLHPAALSGGLNGPEPIRRAMLALIPQSLHSRIQVIVRRDGEFWDAHLELDGWPVQRHSVRFNTAQATGKDAMGSKPPPLNHVPGSFPQINEQEATALVYQTLQEEGARNERVAIKGRSWMPKTEGLVPCLDFDVEYLDRTRVHRKENWCYNASKGTLASRGSRVRF